MPFSKSGDEYPIILLFEDCRFASKNQSISAFQIYRIVDALAQMSISSPNEKQHNLNGDKSNKDFICLPDRYKCVNWSSSFDKSVEKKLNNFTFITTSSIDEYWMDKLSGIKELQMLLLNSFNLSPMKDKLSNKYFLTDPLLAKYNNKFNEDIRAQLCEYTTKYKARRKATAICEDAKYPAKKHRIIVVPFDIYRKTPHEKLELIL